MEKYHNATERELWNQLRTGEVMALDHLIRRFYTPLLNFSAHITNDSHASEEIVSDLFTNLWLKREQLDSCDNIKAYLFTASRNRSLNYVKGKPAHQKVELESVCETKTLSDMLADSNQNLEDLQSALEDIINMLPPKRREIFKLSRIEGLKCQEISKKLGISENTVHNQITEAQKFISSQRKRLMADHSVISIAILIMSLTASCPLT